MQKMVMAMNPAAHRVLEIAATEIGYLAAADPQPGSKYGRWAAAVSGQAWLAGPARSIAWCNLFVSWVFAAAGQGSAIGVEGRKVFAYTVAHRAWFHSRGLIVPVHEALPGDVVFFDWRPGGDPVEHVGIVERNLGGGVLQTIEGNTSGGATGSQAHGGGVWRRVRRRGIATICRPQWKPQENQVISKELEENEMLLQVDGKYWYQTQGTHARMVSDVDILGKMRQVMKTIQISDAQLRANWVVLEEPMIKDLAAMPSRIRGQNDMATGFPGMDPALKRTSLLRKISQKLGIEERTA